jgi:hypothetical protein
VLTLLFSNFTLQLLVPTLHHRRMLLRLHMGSLQQTLRNWWLTLHFHNRSTNSRRLRLLRGLCTRIIRGQTVTRVKVAEGIARSAGGARMLDRDQVYHPSLVGSFLSCSRLLRRTS